MYTSGGFGLLISCLKAEILPFKDYVPIVYSELISEKYTEIAMDQQMGTL